MIIVNMDGKEYNRSIAEQKLKAFSIGSMGKYIIFSIMIEQRFYKSHIL